MYQDVNCNNVCDIETLETNVHQQVIDYTLNTQNWHIMYVKKNKVDL